MQYISGESFLNELYSNMHEEKIVSHGSSKIDSPEEKIATYISRLENVHNRAKEKNKFDTLKYYYYDKYIIKELPNDYYIGNSSELLYEIQNKQKQVLDTWIDYLTSSECNYPMWFKNYVFRGMIAADDELLKKHNANFLELNEEAISNVYDVIYDYVEGLPLTDDQKKALKNGKEFDSVYIYYLNTIKNRKVISINSKNNQKVKKERNRILKRIFR